MAGGRLYLIKRGLYAYPLGQLCIIYYNEVSGVALTFASSSFMQSTACVLLCWFLGRSVLINPRQVKLILKFLRIICIPLTFSFSYRKRVDPVLQ